jgi:PPOX class probable F420-dependent enzyme
MSGRLPVETCYPQEASNGGYFASLAAARYLQVTTFGRGGRPVPARVRGVVDGARAYFGARSWSGTVRRLRHADVVQVAPCGALGWCYGPPLDATARLLPAEEAVMAAAELTRTYPVRRRSLTCWLHRAWRPKIVHYELVAEDDTNDQDTCPQRLPAPGQRGDRSGSHAVRGSQGSRPCQIRHTRVTDHGAGSIACIWSAPAGAPALTKQDRIERQCPDSAVSPIGECQLDNRGQRGPIP